MGSSGRFPVATFVSVVLQIIGWLGVALGLLLVGVQLDALMSPGGRGSGAVKMLFSLLPSIGVFVGGFLTVLAGQLGAVFVSMEYNTHLTQMQLSALEDAGHRGRLEE